MQKIALAEMAEVAKVLPKLPVLPEQIFRGSSKRATNDPKKIVLLR